MRASLSRLRRVTMRTTPVLLHFVRSRVCNSTVLMCIVPHASIIMMAQVATSLHLRLGPRQLLQLAFQPQQRHRYHHRHAQRWPTSHQFNLAVQSVTGCPGPHASHRALQTASQPSVGREHARHNSAIVFRRLVATKQTAILARAATAV